MKNPNEDTAYEQWRQAKIDRDWDTLPQVITCRQKIGTTIPFSRTVDRDPWARVLPFSNPIPDFDRRMPMFSKTEAALWAVLISVIILWVVTR